jgi:hypothetical protein
MDSMQYVCVTPKEMEGAICCIGKEEVPQPSTCPYTHTMFSALYDLHVYIHSYIHTYIHVFDILFDARAA